MSGTFARTFPDGQAIPARDPRMRLVINPGWLVKLRWAAVIGQILTISIVGWGFRIPLAYTPLLVIIAIIAATNVAFHLWCHRMGRQPLVAQRASRVESVLGSLLLLDLCLLTGLLYYSGGAENPFVLFYLVNLALSAVLLRPLWAWTLTFLATAAMRMLIAVHVPFPVARDELIPTPLGELSGAQLVGLGQLVAVATAATVITYFVTRLTRDQARLEQELRTIDQRRARSEKLEALGALAGGAAHELASPLSTIAVVVKELSRRVANSPAPSELTDDLQLIREEVDRCRTILNRMAADAGEVSGEGVSLVSPDELLEEILSGLRLRSRVQKTLGPGVEQARLWIPKVALAQALRGLVQNALDASGSTGVVTLSAEIAGKRLRLVCRDQGVGMPAEVLARAGEPFYTTKGVGRGMGLGLFLARSVVDRLGGSLDLKSVAEEGTTATVQIPLATESRS
jgi:two-component system, sensor histidine kinase RegB